MNISEQKTLIFLGASGCGKGTQIKLLKEYMNERGNTIPFVHLIMGDLFRAFWKTEGYTRDISSSIMDVGGLQPAFLQVKLWSGYFLNNITGNEHIIIDGSPRRIEDAILMESAFDFYCRKNVTLVYLQCDDEEVRRRMIDRAAKDRRKEDQSIDTIDSRIEWFNEFVIPAIDYFRNKEKFNFIEINGNVSIEEVWGQIKQKVFNDND